MHLHVDDNFTRSSSCSSSCLNLDPIRSCPFLANCAPKCPFYIYQLDPNPRRRLRDLQKQQSPSAESQHLGTTLDSDGGLGGTPKRGSLGWGQGGQGVRRLLPPPPQVSVGAALSRHHHEPPPSPRCCPFPIPLQTSLYNAPRECPHQPPFCRTNVAVASEPLTLSPSAPVLVCRRLPAIPRQIQGQMGVTTSPPSFPVHLWGGSMAMLGVRRSASGTQGEGAVGGCGSAGGSLAFAWPALRATLPAPAL